MAADRANRQTTGHLGEQLAASALERRGYEIVERNWRCPSGEIDLVALDGPCWVFVEVKTRRGHGAELPEDALTEDKARRLIELAAIYLAERGLGDVDWRIDLIAVEMGPRDQVARLRVIPGVAIE